jgi:DICT domain-containing protein
MPMLAGSVLQKLLDAHKVDGEAQPSLSFGVYYKNTLVALCHALEDSILNSDFNPLVITAFQRGKWYLQEADRYHNIADHAQQIVIMAAPEAGFADHPTSQRENVSLVDLVEDDPVAQEWHLIIVSPNYTAMVLCQELSEADYGPAGQPQADLERKFYGLWTFEPGLVQETAALAIAHIRSYDPALSDRLQAQLEQIKIQCQAPEALCNIPAADHLGNIVSRVVSYLQDSQHDLSENGAAYLFSQGLDNNLLSNELQAFLRVAQLVDQTDLRNPQAAAEVATLAESMGQLLDLPAWQLHRLRLAGLLHRIAFLRTVNSTLPAGTTPRYDEPPTVPLACPLEPGTQMLRRMPRLRAIATILTHQAEWWNGKGQPAALAGDEIPVESRILGLVSAFQAALVRSRQTHPDPDATAVTPSPAALSQAFESCKAQQGERWDPKLVETLGLLVNAMKQGLSLPVAIPKVASGLWLLDPSEESASAPAGSLLQNLSS